MQVEPSKTPKKDSAIELRARGMSYSEIQKVLAVPKSTLSLWVRDVEFPEVQKIRLKKKRLQAGLAAVEKRKQDRRRETTEIRRSAMQDIKLISKRELWLSGLLLYWSSSPMQRKAEYTRGVCFSNSNPDLVKFFLKWLTQVGGIARDDIMFDLFISENDRRRESFIVSNWIRITDFPIKFFPRIYYIKGGAKRRETPRQSRLGLVRIRVKESSLLQKQIDGWINALITQSCGASERERQKRTDLLA